MIQIMNSAFQNAFNLGLSLSASVEEYKHFIDLYKPYIHSIYFSLPLGAKFHTRSIIAQQFEDPEIQREFWDLLRLFNDHNIKLELVLNTYRLNEIDLLNAKKLLTDKGISVDFVSILDEYYESVKDLFPGIPVVYSFNNNCNFNNENALLAIKGKYEYIVVGRSFLRDNAAFRNLSEAGFKVVHLLNNGCSFNCKTCRESNECYSIFSRNLAKYDIEYLYALQSVMPFELYDGSIQTQYISVYKISNRSSGLRYLQRCLNSYLNNRVLDYLNIDKLNLALWCKLRHITKYCYDMDIEKIFSYKEEILRHNIIVK